MGDQKKQTWPDLNYSMSVLALILLRRSVEDMNRGAPPREREFLEMYHKAVAERKKARDGDTKPDTPPEEEEAMRHLVQAFFPEEPPEAPAPAEGVNQRPERIIPSEGKAVDWPKFMGLSQADYSAVTQIIPPSVKPGTPLEAAFVLGAKQAKMGYDKPDPPGPMAAKSVNQAVYCGFKMMGEKMKDDKKGNLWYGKGAKPRHVSERELQAMYEKAAAEGQTARQKEVQDKYGKPTEEAPQPPDPQLMDHQKKMEQEKREAREIEKEEARRLKLGKFIGGVLYLLGLLPILDGALAFWSPGRRLFGVVSWLTGAGLIFWGYTRWTQTPWPKGLAGLACRIVLVVLITTWVSGSLSDAFESGVRGDSGRGGLYVF